MKVTLSLVCASVAACLLLPGCGISSSKVNVEGCSDEAENSSLDSQTDPERTEWDDSQGKGNEISTTYDAEGRMMTRARFWNHRIVTLQHFDTQGRVRFSMTNLLIALADLSSDQPEDFARSTWSHRLKAVYIVENPHVTDTDILALYEDDRIQAMIVERCPNVSQSALRRIESKLVRDWPEGMFE